MLNEKAVNALLGKKAGQNEEIKAQERLFIAIDSNVCQRILYTVNK